VFFDATDAEVDDAVSALQAALRLNLGDHFAFDVTRIAPLQEEARAPASMSIHDSVRHRSPASTSMSWWAPS
jgi:hypothetical protein